MYCIHVLGKKELAISVNNPHTQLGSTMYLIRGQASFSGAFPPSVNQETLSPEHSLNMGKMFAQDTPTRRYRQSPRHTVHGHLLSDTHHHCFPREFGWIFLVDRTGNKLKDRASLLTTAHARVCVS